MRVLVVEDEDIKRVSLVDDLRDAGFDVVDHARPESALEELERRRVDVTLTDLRMPGMSGLELLREIRAKSPETDVIVMTAFGTVDSAIEAMRHGAYDYISKPFASEQMIVVLERLARERRLRRDNEALRVAAHAARETHGGVIATSPVMVALLEQVRRVANSDVHVLLVGETGTGKDRIARMIHEWSERARRPFVKIACATYAEHLLESELFGRERGAYTGADTAQAGHFELGHEGTIYLDDVDDIPYAAQTRLLRVVEERVIERVGGARIIPVDVRVIASTKVALGELVRAGRFRADLYHRLNVATLRVPALRERPQEVRPLIDYFCRASSDERPCHVPDEILAILERYRWPGNVRELRNLVERWKLLKQTDRTLLCDLPPEIRDGSDLPTDSAEECSTSFEEAVAALERRLLSDALRRAVGNKTKAAELLKLKPSTFRNKLSQHGLGTG